jgi:hypothetical protein
LVVTQIKRFFKAKTCLRQTFKPANLKAFKWAKLIREAKVYMPTLMPMLTSAMPDVPTLQRQDLKGKFVKRYMIIMSNDPVITHLFHCTTEK